MSANKSNYEAIIKKLLRRYISPEAEKKKATGEDDEENGKEDEEQAKQRLHRTQISRFAGLTGSFSKLPQLSSTLGPRNFPKQDPRSSLPINRNMHKAMLSTLQTVNATEARAHQRAFDRYKQHLALMRERVRGLTKSSRTFLHSTLVEDVCYMPKQSMARPNRKGLANSSSANLPPPEAPLKSTSYFLIILRTEGEEEHCAYVRSDADEMARVRGAGSPT
jgi:hypothetical protein